MGNFGHINYGQTLVGRVFYPSEANHNGCKAFEESQFGDDFTKEAAMNQFIIVKRGHCSNPLKVRNIE